MLAMPYAHRLLVVANQTCPCPELAATVAATVADGGEVLVVSPALNRRLRHWVSDVDAAVAAAAERLALAVDHLAEAGVSARGEVGDADPLLAIDDALAGFTADEIVISTHPPGRSNWLEKGLIEKARERYLQPVTHVVSEVGLEPVGGSSR